MKSALLIALLFCLTLTGCKSDPVCTLEETASVALSGTIASQLACSHPEVIKADILSALSKVKMCSQPIPMPKNPSTQSAVGIVLCPLAVNTVVDMMMSKVPETWGCLGGGKPELVKTALTTACAAAL